MYSLQDKEHFALKIALISTVPFAILITIASILVIRAAL